MSSPINALVVIPTYNEAENIASLCKAVSEVPGVGRVLVVDDSSPDGTADKVREAARALPLDIIVRSKKDGRGGAVLDGFASGLQNASFTHFVEMDSDFSHNPTEISRLFEQTGKYDLVIGSRYIPGSSISNWPLRRRIFSYLANRFARFMLGVPVRDYTNGFRVYSRKAIEALDRKSIQPKGFITLSAILLQLYLKGFSVTEVPTNFVNRIRGVSNLSRREIFEALRSVFELRRLRKQ
ncbi:MAG: polyprenol monophosphomannose synthase [Bdellovibrionota bacterium]